MQRRYLVARLFVLASVIVVPTLGVSTWAFAASASRRVTHVKLRAAVSSDDVKITKACDHLHSDVSLGLSKPTLISHIDGVDAVIFATSTKYSACIVWNDKNEEANQPTSFVAPSGVNELESFASINKIPGRALYKINTWFVVKVSPTVFTLRAVTRGSCQVSQIGDGFAFVHVNEKADLHGKFAYGVAVGFNASGELVGSTTLR